MLAWIALGLLLAALILFLNLRRYRNRGGLPAGELVFADNTPQECPVLVSYRYGLKGKPDALVRIPDGALIPVERKNGRAPRRPYDGDLIQTAVYCVLVEDNYGQTPPFMRIQYADRWFDELFTNRHREWVMQVSARLREARRAGACNRSHRASRVHPKGCSFNLS
jgi:hypothetical protein